MNERIKLLAEQAGYSTDPVPYLNPGVDPRLEKFAELIVRECEAYIKEHTWAESGELIKHFGIEE